MWRYIVCLLLLSVAVDGVSTANKKNWEYTIISVDSNCSDTSILEFDLKNVRISRGSYAISGYAEFKVEIDDTFYGQIYIYRSASGSSNYQLTAMRVENQTMSSFLNNPYREYVMSSANECSNLPQLEGTWTPPMQPTRFTLDKCIVKTDNLPSYMPTGFYKLVITLTRINFEATIIGIVKIESLLT